MKHFLPAAFALLLSAFTATAQTTLPTSFDFNTTPDPLPTGWTTNTTDFYSSGLGGSNAGKLTDDGHYFQIDLSDEPGQVTYYLAYYGSGNFGEFELQESENGNTWSTIRLFQNGDLSNGWTQYTDTADRDSRYIRFIYTVDESGTNVGLEDVSVAIAPPPTTPEINVVNASSETIPTGSQEAFSTPVGDSTDVVLTVENIGTEDTLYVSGVNITGSAASDYTVLTMPDTIANNSSAALTLRFKPTASGTRAATLEISSNDSNEDPYIIELFGVGDDFATEPTAQAGGISFSNIMSWSMDATLNGSASQPDGYLVLRQNGSAVTDTPTDGMTYVRGDVIGDAKVAYVGDAADFDLNDIVADRTVHFAVFSYNGPGQYRNYLQASPYTTSQQASGNMMGSYYAGISSSSTSFLSDLADRIANPHSEVFYSNYELLLIPDVYARDTTGGEKVVTCMYSGEQRVYTGSFSWTAHNFAREHTFARSWMPPDGTMSTDELPGADLHNLHPTNQNDVNAVRSNYPFGTSDNISSTYLDATLWSDINNQKWYEVRDQHKGDVARSILYMLMRYHFDATWGVYDWADFPFELYQQDQAVLKAWHAQDPPSGFEIARNDYIETEQRNRNPFIDHPEWVDLIDFEQMAPVSVTEVSAVRDLTVFPNPNNGNFRISFNLENGEQLTARLVDVTGKQIWAQQLNGNSGYNYVDVADLNLASGMYLLETTDANGTVATQKVLVK